LAAEGKQAEAEGVGAALGDAQRELLLVHLLGRGELLRGELVDGS